MVNTESNFQFELSTGILCIDQTCIDDAEAGDAPLNLVQLSRLGRLAVYNPSEVVDPKSEAAVGKIVPLSEVLQSKQYGDIDKDAYERLDVSEWTRDDYIEYGQWLDSLTRDPLQVRSRLTKYVLQCAYDLGVGPSVSNITHKRFKALTPYYQAIGIVPNRDYGKFKDLSDQDLADYAESVLLDLKNQRESRTSQPIALAKEIERRAQQGQGPGIKMYRRDGGSLSEILALNGYSNVSRVSPEYCVELGVKFMQANNGHLPTKKALNFLSNGRRAPHSSRILDKFRWADYLEQVQEAYSRPDSYAVRQKIPTIKQEIQNGTLPHSVIKDGAVSEVLERRAKWLLLTELFPALGALEKEHIAKSMDITIFKRVISIYSNGKIEDADIEHTVARLGIAEDLWPSRQPYMDYLKVPKRLLK